MRAADPPAAIRLQGAFVFSVHRHFRRALCDALPQASREIVVDLAAVGEIDSAALGMLLIARDRANERGKRIAIEGATGPVLQVLKIANFTRFFELR